MRGVASGKWEGVRKRSCEWRKRWTVVSGMSLGGQLALEGSMVVVTGGGGAICSHMTDKQPTVTSETRSAGRSYPIMSGMLAVTRAQAISAVCR